MDINYNQNEPKSIMVLYDVPLTTTNMDMFAWTTIMA